MTKLYDIGINFFNLKTELYFNNYTASTDTINNVVTIVSKPLEKITPLYIVKDISLLQEKQTTQAIRQQQ